MFSRVSRSWTVFTSWTLKERHTVKLQLVRSVDIFTQNMSFTVVYLCLWWVSVKWLNFSRISFALKYTYTHHNKTHAIYHNANRNQDPHIPNRTDSAAYLLYQARGGKGGEPLTHGGVWFEKTFKEKMSKWTLLDHSETISTSSDIHAALI